MDSGASQHILKDLQFFYNYTPFAPDKHRPVRLAAEGHRVWAVGSGSVFLSTKRGSWYLSHALYVPDSKQNFISVTAATDEGSSFLVRGDVCQISCNQFGSMLRVNAHKVRNSYILAAVPMPDGPDTDSEPEQLYNVQQSALQPDPKVKLELLTNVPAPSANSTTSNSPQVWHQRLCHTSYDALARMQSAGMVSGVPVTAAQFRAAASDPAVCVGCVKGKQHKNVAFAGPPPNAAPVTVPLGLIHMDVCGPMHARARDGSLYVATFLDEHTKLSVCVPISSKAQVPDIVRTVIEELETQSGYRCKAIRTDNGTEYFNSRMREYCASKGIVHQHSAPYSPQQNGAAEHLNRTIFEKARNIIHSADISLSFWAHAVKFANHVRCLLPVSGQPLTPWEAFYGVKPDLSGLRVFGCRVWLHVPDHQRSKLQAKSV
ncbi:DDE-type integrase/transposase/recombinase, partial [Bosea sp. (in: a-proteobacteria)]|uniref:DDE-type integrase/transposase/recombinase n=1 Tax=Bosea sp. (in: a-proteobacteria) TaxID=1871050 RepID=UPI004033D48D